MEEVFISFLMNFLNVDQLNSILRDPRTVAILVGSLVSISGAVLGSYLLLLKRSLTSDAISHTVLLGIVIAFIVMTGWFNLPADFSSPWLILGATIAGIATVALTEFVNRSGLIREDTALGLVFPFLFALAVILISTTVEKVHLDEDTVLVGEIGIAWANSESLCFENCDEITITPDHPQAEMGRECINCSANDINPRSPDAVFQQICMNCGTYSAARAWSQGLTDVKPLIVSFPSSLSVMGPITLLVILFTLAFYKELKISTFDAGLAAALGFKPGAIVYGLMILVSLTAVGAFDAVGSILVVAFFIIPPATAYLLTDRLGVMLVLAPIIGLLGAISGYDLAQGSVLGIIHMNDLLFTLDRWIGLDGYTTWNVSISASMVIMTFIFFILAWVFSPKYGLMSSIIRNFNQKRSFSDQMLLTHVYNHTDTPAADIELSQLTLHEHLGWSRAKVQRTLTRLRLQNLVTIGASDIVKLTDKGRSRVQEFNQRNLIRGAFVQG